MFEINCLIARTNIACVAREYYKERKESWKKKNGENIKEEAGEKQLETEIWGN